MPVTVKVKGDLSKLKALASKIPTAARVKIGIIDNPEVATYAAYNEYGWVQRVTPRQSGFLRNNFKVDVMPGMTLMSPPRPFLRATAKAKSEEWTKTFAEGVQALGIERANKVLELVGRQAQVDVQETIKNNGTGGERFPERSDLTMAIYAEKDAKTEKGRKRKISGTSGSGRTQALVRSGVLLGSIGYEVENG